MVYSEKIATVAVQAIALGKRIESGSIVKRLNKGQIGDGPFVPCREVVLFSEYNKFCACLYRSFSTKCRGRAYMGDATFSLVITPSLNQEMLSGFVDAGFVLARLQEQ